MPNSKVKIALCLIVKGDDKEADYLSQCLNLISHAVDGIFITITQKNAKTKKVAELYGAITSFYKWDYNFSNARNFNFSQVPKDYTHILWLDADDGIRGIENLREILEQHPDIDIFRLNYMYAFDEWKNPVVVHQKTQIVKNNDCVEWVGALHEDFRPKRKLNGPFLIKDIERIHLSKSEHFEEAKERNLEISQKMSKDLPDDPRSYWNLGNSLRAIGKMEESIEIFKKFSKMSKSDDEKYIVKLRMAESYWLLKKYNEAIDEVRYAIGIKPEYPDAYFLLGSIYLETNNLDEAQKMFLIGLVKPRPYYSIIVYNPRDYDYTPMMNLAKVYFAKNLPQLAVPLLEGCLQIYPKDERTKNLVKEMKILADKEDKVMRLVKRLGKIKDKKKLKEEFEKIPKEFRSHPGVCNLRNLNFVKEKSSGKDLIFFCGYTEEIWSPKTAEEKGIGGSEEAIIHLSNQLADKGWSVTVYNNCGHLEKKYGKVTYKPFWMWNYRDKQDVVVLWRSPRHAMYEINSPKVYVDLHDVIEEGELSKERLERITKIFVKSDFHRSVFPDVPDDKFIIVPNGIDSKIFQEEVKRDPLLMINTSSPDRSLSALLDCYEKIKKEVPDVKLKWAYGWTVFDIVHGDDPEIMEWKNKMNKKMEELGVENLGRISHSEVAKLYLSAGVFAYPCEFAEIDCISLSKAQAAGAIPVTTDFSALGAKEKHGGFFVHSKKTKDNWCQPYQHDFSLQGESERERWTEYAIKALKSPASEFIRQQMRESAQKAYDWAKIAKIWDLEFNS